MGDGRLDEATSTFQGRDALPSPSSMTGSPHDDGPGLPMTALGRKIRPKRLVIRWMSVNGLILIAPLK